MTKRNFLLKKTSIRPDSWDFCNISSVLYSNCLHSLYRRDHISESHRMCFNFCSQTELEIEYGYEFEQTPRDNEGQESLASCSPKGHKEVTSEQANNNNNLAHFFDS